MSANCQDSISNRGLEDYQLEHDEDNEGPNRRHVDTRDIAAAHCVIDELLSHLVGSSERKTGGDGITNSLKQKERPQSDKQGWKAKQCNKNTIQCADKYPT